MRDRLNSSKVKFLSRVTTQNGTQLSKGAQLLPEGWARRLNHVFESPEMASLRQFLKEEYRASRVILPPKEHYFRALQAVDYEDVRVVILGQDPYHGVNQANGLAFAVNKPNRAPPSLLNIFKEIESDLQVPRPTNTELLGWAKQGVLLLNTVLSVRLSTPYSHRDRGWESFTDAVIRELAKRETPLVFLLWGAAAQKKAQLIDSKHHCILKTTHPSPLSAAKGFMGSKHFSKANEFLRSRGLKEINWEDC